MAQPVFTSHPNQRVEEGQLVYTLDAEPYEIDLNRKVVAEHAANVALEVAIQDVSLNEQQYEATKADLKVLESQLAAAKEDAKWKVNQLNRYITQNNRAPNTVTESVMDEQRNKVQLAESQIANRKSQIATLEKQIQKAKIGVEQARLIKEKSVLAVATKEAELESTKENTAQAEWNLEQTRVRAPADGYVTNFIMREGQFVGMIPRIHMYTDEKYVLMRVNHQAIRNVKVGQYAEFASPVYPGKIFKAEVEGIVEATGESQARLIATDDNVRMTTGSNLANKHHFVRLRLEEPEGYDIPVGAVGLAWVSGEKPIGFMSFLDVIRGIIIRMKAQLYFIYSI